MQLQNVCCVFVLFISFGPHVCASCVDRAVVCASVRRLRVWVFLSTRGAADGALGRRRQSCSERRGAAAFLSRRALTRDPNNFVHWKLFKAISAGFGCRASLTPQISSRIGWNTLRAITRALSRVYATLSVYF